MPNIPSKNPKINGIKNISAATINLLTNFTLNFFILSSESLATALMKFIILNMINNIGTIYLIQRIIFIIQVITLLDKLHWLGPTSLGLLIP